MNSLSIRFQFCLVLACAATNLHADWENEPNEIGAYMDLGQIVKGSYYTAGTQDNAKGIPLSRTGVYMTYAGISDKKFEVRLTAGGLFWYSFSNGGEISDRILQFGPGVGEAQGIYSFGDPSDPSAKLQFGLFPYKYNPDANNLGEYLYRCDAYPNTIWNGGWSYLNSADYLAEGAHFNLPTFGGKVIHDFTLFIERGIEPTDDLSPGYTVTIKPTSFLEFGGGLEWAHAFSFNPDAVTPKDLNNAYSKSTNTPYSLALSNVGSVANLDPTNPLYPIYRAHDSLYWVRDSLTLTTPASQLGYYTFQAVKAMARISLDFGSLLNMPDLIPANSFKVYAEWAMLGIKNYPYYYKNPWQRMPIMAGVNIPTFKLLDKLNCEVEYYKSDWVDDISSVYNGNGFPLPATPTNPNAPTTKWRWSVYASRHITKGLNIYAQAASDHERQLYAGPGGADYSTVSSTPFSRDWYYIIRLEYGLF